MNNKCLRIKEMTLAEFCKALSQDTQARLVVVAENLSLDLADVASTELSRVLQRKHNRKRENFLKSLPSRMRRLNTYDVLVMWRRNFERYHSDQNNVRKEKNFAAICEFIDGLRALGYPQQKINKTQGLAEIESVGASSREAKTNSTTVQSIIAAGLQWAGNRAMSDHYQSTHNR